MLRPRLDVTEWFVGDEVTLRKGGKSIDGVRGTTLHEPERALEKLFKAKGGG